MGFHDAASALLALVAVVAMILLSRHGWKFADRLRPNGKAVAGVAVAGSLAIDPKRRLNVLTCDGKRLLILTGGPNDLVVGWAPNDEAES